MSLGTLTSRILGMVRDIVLLALFPRIVTDAFVVAFRLPNVFRRVLGEGSLSASFVPVFVEQWVRDKEQASRLASAILSLLWIVTGAISVLGVIFMDDIIAAWVSGQGYQAVEGKEELTVFLARLMFSYLFLVTTYAFLMSIANSLKRFFWPAVAPAFFNLIEIIFSFVPHFHQYGDQLAWGVLVGGIVQVVIVMLTLKGCGIQLRLTTQWKVPGMEIFWKGLLPSAIGMGVGQIIAVVNVYFASRLEQGAHSYIYLADRLLEFPQSLIAVSLGVALLPTLSEMWSKGNRTEMLREHQKHMRILLAVALPAAVGLYALAEPIVEAIYKRGEFGGADVAATANVTRVYAFVLVVSGLHRVMVPGFYAIKNTWVPAAMTVVAIAVHIVTADILTKKFGLVGLVSATAITGFINLVGLSFLYRYFIGSLEVRRLLVSFVHLLPAALIMGWVANFVYGVTVEHLGNMLSLGLAIVVGVFSMAAMASFIRHPEAAHVLSRFRTRLKR